MSTMNAIRRGGGSGFACCSAGVSTAARAARCGSSSQAAMRLAAVATTATTKTDAPRRALASSPLSSSSSSRLLVPGNLLSGSRRRLYSASSPRSVSAAASSAASPDDGVPKQKQQKQKQKQKQRKKDGGEDESANPYKSTILLPETPFGMRANASVREPELQRKWDEEKTYEALLSKNAAPSGDGAGVAGAFTLHDGPPYANGDAHLGHALNKILKSFIVNWKLLSGKRARYVPGWDCHGLPIELKVLQGLKEKERRELTPEGLRRKARDYALETVDAQRAQFRRYGLFGDWERPYLTLDPSYEAAQLRVFGALALGGHVYRGRKPVHWSPSSRTALAEAELEYPPGHVSRSVYVAFAVEELSRGAREAIEASAGAGASGRPLSLAIWTTTAWTLPANAAVAVNERLTYAAIDLGDGSPLLVVAEGLAGAVAAKARQGKSGKGGEGAGGGEGGEGAGRGELEAPFDVVAKFPGSALEGTTYRTPLDAPDPSNPPVRRVVVGGDYITTESGTGLVHTAPGHGQEDYGVGLRCGLPMPAPVDDAGRFTSDAGQGLEGLAVLKEGTDAVIGRLLSGDALLLEERYEHKYPYDWRTKKPTIFRATDQWFVSVERFRSDALAAAEGVEWIPASGKRRIVSMVEGRSDWCISRQRTWGVPIPVLYRKRDEGGGGSEGGRGDAVGGCAPGEPLLTQESVEHMASLVERHERGSDVFWSATVEELLPKSLKPRASEFEKRQIETMDVWFDSGTSWAGVVEAREGLSFPADLYLEGSDQHRGWFQSSLLTAVAARGGGSSGGEAPSAPYKAVLTHGFALDEKGAKMSKSLGNVVDPRTIIEGGKDQKKQPPYGADVLRLWAASVDYSGDVLVGPTVLAQTADAYRKLRFTLRFLLGNLHDYDPDAGAWAPAEEGGASDATGNKNGPVPVADLPLTDKYMLHRLSKLQDDVSSAMESYAFSKASGALASFCSSELSNWYLDAAKDRLYVRGASSDDRRACQTVLGELLLGLMSCLAPLTPHLAEDAWSHLPWRKDGGPSATPPSVFLAGWRRSPRPSATELPPEDVAAMDALLLLRGEANKALQAAQRAGAVGAGLDARVAVFVGEGRGGDVAGPSLRAALERMQGSPNGADPLRYNLIVSRVDLVESREEVTGDSMPFSQEAEIEFGVAGDGGARGGGGVEVAVGVARAEGGKCQRCWAYSPLVGGAADAGHPGLCERCAPVVRELGVASPVTAAGAETVPA